MAKTKLERIANIEDEIKQLENQRKQLLQQYKEQERKERTHRICKRGGLLESMLPDTIPLTDEQFKTFLEKAVANDFGRRMLATITVQNAAQVAPQITESAQNNATVTAQTVGNGAGKVG